MAIVQFKHRAARVDSGLPELGRLYKGAPRQSENQKQIPPDLDHFRFEGNNLPTATADDVNAAWDALYGDKPRVIRNVQFAIDRLDLAFDAWQEEWGKSRSGTPLLNKRCDGETIHFERRGDEVYRQPAACSHQCQCKPTGRLRVFLPEFCAQLGVLGTVTLITHAGTDIDNISNSLNLVLERAGRLRNVAFVLSREKVQLMTPAGLPVQKWIVRLELDTASAQMVASLAAGEALALPSGVPSARAENRPALPQPQYATEYDKFDENGDDLPESDAPDKGTDDVWEDVEETPPAQNEHLIGTAALLEIRSTGKGRSYHIRFENGTPMILQGFDGIRAIGPQWSAHADSWKAWEPGTYSIVPLRVYTGAGAVRFASDLQPEVSE
jgi:hypothetical protein